VPTVNRLPAHFRSTIHRFVGFCALADIAPQMAANRDGTALAIDGRRDTMDSPKPCRLRIVVERTPPG
jgi:hypothetical protein